MGCCVCTCALVLVLLYLAYLVFKPSARRPPSRPPVSAERKRPRGTGPVIECVYTATGEKLGSVRAYTAEEVKEAYKAAKAAALEWRNSSWAERRALLQDILDFVVEHQDKIVEMSMKDSGKTALEAMLGEVMTTCEKIRWLIANGEKVLRPEPRPVPLLLAFTKKAHVEYMPMGVIGIIVPWNYPVHNVFSHVVSALMAGNGALVKVSEYASYSAEWMEDVFRTLLARRGWNPDLVQIVTGYAETGQALVDSGVEKILFIGSPAVGAKVMERAAKNLTPVTLELGGKDPFIVFDDCEFDHMVDVALRGAFINCGQNCVSAERFYVQAGIYDKFLDAVVRKLQQTRQGPSILPAERANADATARVCDFGAMTMPLQVKIVEELVEDAKRKGARVLFGGKRGECKNGALYFEPTVLADVTHDMKIANEECFGPVMTVIKFHSEEEVIRMANCTRYGLGGSVFTTDYRKAQRVTSALETGMVTINDFGLLATVQSLPFGGVKHSGFGCFGGYEGLRAFCYRKAVMTDRFPFLRTKAPPFLLYPVWPNSELIVKEAMRLIYGKSWAESLSALAGLLKQLLAAPKRKHAKSH